MSEDFGTVNIRRGDRGRELEVLRQHYRRHREALAKMLDDAPTEALAADYLRLIEQIDRSLLKLGELDTMVVPPPRATSPGIERLPEAPPPPPAPQAQPTSSFGEHPLLNVEEGESAETYSADGSRSRIAMILVAAVAALFLVGWLVWRASSDRKGSVGGEVVETVSEPVETTVAPDTVAPAPAAMKITPVSHDYGVIRKGTRATRQFEVTNETEEPISIQLSRSACRCLYYEHAEVIPPKAKEGVTVTVDAAKAKAGALKETVKVTVKGQPDVGTSFDVIATVQ